MYKARPDWAGSSKKPNTELCMLCTARSNPMASSNTNLILRSYWYTATTDLASPSKS